MGVSDIEEAIFNCPHVDSFECNNRLNCHPIPGSGPSHPKFLILGLNPARRRDIWCEYDSLEELKTRYQLECLKPQYTYGNFLATLQNLVPQIRIPDNAYLSDVVKCPTTMNEPPPNMMVEQCASTYLEKTICALAPEFIIGLGSAPAKYVGGFLRSKGSIVSSRVAFGNHYCWFVSVPHPRGGAVGKLNSRTIAETLKKIINAPEASVTPTSVDALSYVQKSKTGNMISQKLTSLDYRAHGNRWVKGSKTVHIVSSSGFGERIRILWREKWKDDFAVIYDYSGVGGPVCIVPIRTLFSSSFVKEKRRSQAYANSGYWWSQPFPTDHELAKLVTSHEDRWDIL